MIACVGVSKYYPTSKGASKGLVALQDTHLEVQENEFVTILGPSGCGKSTLLFLVAGFVLPSSGAVFVDGEEVTGPSPEKGVVFQEFALFPWLRVRENVEYGLKERGVSRAERRAIAEEMLQLTGLSRFVHYYPHQLSGGMKQRVALARVLANDPKVLLLDEPFGALDEQQRIALQGELLRIWEERKKTALFVTHSIEEAIVLGDRIVVMASNPGRIRTVLPVDLKRPRDRTSDEFNAVRRAVTEALWEGKVPGAVVS